jgi:DNA-binding response OmpR family regulator
MSEVDVLVVDDDGDTRGAIVTAVVSLGYPCQSARDGREALQVYAREGAAIVLTDWRMPHLDGLELCRALKREPSPPYVILMSTIPQRTHLSEAIGRGADEFLLKPFDFDYLEARLLVAARLATRANQSVRAPHANGVRGPRVTGSGTRPSVGLPLPGGSPSSSGSSPPAGKISSRGQVPRLRSGWLRSAPKKG